MNALRSVFVGVVAGALAACRTVGPAYSVPVQAAINLPAAGGPFIDTAADKGIDLAPVPDGWWHLYKDPLLDHLVRMALASNADLRVAAANLGKADAEYDMALHAGGFTYGVDAGLQRAQLSAESYLMAEKLPVYNLASTSLGVSYALDLFGKLKRGSEAARADAQARQAALALARIVVVAEVASAYAGVCDGNHQLEVAQHALDLQKHSLDVAKRLVVAGRGTATDITRANAQVDALRATLPPLQAGKKASEYKLAALLGHVPGDIPAGVDRCSKAPSLASAVPIGDAMAMLGRRPDVREAERELAAATARIGVATAELYPEITIGGSLGAAGLARDFGNAETRSWSLGPLISWSIPSANAHARVHATEAGAAAALAQFDGVVLNALSEVQTALSTYSQDTNRVQALAQARNEASQAAAQNRELYEAGRLPYLSSLDADRTRASSDGMLAAAQAQLTEDQIKLFLALGGGWTQP